MKLSLPKHTKTVVKVIINGSSRNREANTENGARLIEKEKEEFLKHGKFSKSRLKKSSTQGEKSRKKSHVGVSFEFLPEAKRILDLVNEKFENGDGYLEEVFGEPIEQSEASKYLIEYLQMQGLEGALRIRDPDQRWKHVMRAKRDLDDYSGFGGTGKDQSYFTGAVRILRNAGDIDFKLLCSGKLCFDELKRVKRVSRASVKLPHFLDNIALYRHALKEMLYINGLQPMVILHSLRRKPIIQAVRRKRRTLLASMEQNKEKFLRREELDKWELFTDYGNYEMFSIRELIMPKLVY